jgi:hypothetical protein
MTESAIDLTAIETTAVADATSETTETKTAKTVKVETTAEPAVDDKTADKSAEKPASAWGDNWREDAAGNDEDLLKLAKRYSSGKGILKALRDAQVKISSGVKLAKPDEADAAAMAEWRKAEGIPEAATGYVIPEPVQKRLVDDDKPILSSFMEYMHKQGARSAEVAATAAWYVDMQEAAAAKQTQDDAAAGEKTEDALRKDWSHAEYKGNIAMAHNWVKEIPGMGTDLAVVRGPDGRRLVDNPAFISWAADQARASGMDNSFITGDSAAKSATRKAEIEKVMNTDIDKYYQDGLDKELAVILEKETARKK